MKTLYEVARRLEGMAQNAADRANCMGELDCGYGTERRRMVEFIELAEVINKHIAECPQCKQSQSR